METMAITDELTLDESHDYDERLWKIIEIWPRLPKRIRWELFIRSWWYTVKADLKKIRKDLKVLAEVVVYTLKRK